MNGPVLGEIPLEQTVREGGDNGKPIVLEEQHSAAATAFLEATGNMEQQLALRKASEGPTEKVEIKFRP